MAQIILEARNVQKTYQLGPSLLRVLSPGVRKLLGQQVQVLQLLQDRPVMLVSPYLMTVE